MHLLWDRTAQSIHHACCADCWLCCGCVCCVYLHRALSWDQVPLDCVSVDFVKVLADTTHREAYNRTLRTTPACPLASTCPTAGAVWELISAEGGVDMDAVAALKQGSWAVHFDPYFSGLPTLWRMATDPVVPSASQQQAVDQIKRLTLQRSLKPAVRGSFTVKCIYGRGASNREGCRGALWLT